MILPDRSPACTEIMVLFRIISRHDWDRMQSWARACPGSEIEHLMHGLFLLTIPAGGAVEVAA